MKLYIQNHQVYTLPMHVYNLVINGKVDSSADVMSSETHCVQYNTKRYKVFHHHYSNNRL